LRQILQINGQILGDTHKHRHPAHSRNGPGHWRQRKGIGQNAVPMPHAQRPQGCGHRIAPRCHGKAIFRPHLCGKFLFQQRGFGHFAGGGVIAVQPA